MVKDSVLISSTTHLRVGPDGDNSENQVIVTFGGKVVTPELVYGSSLAGDCRGILVPYGATITFKVASVYNVTVYLVGIDRPIILYENGTTNTFLAVRDTHLLSATISQNNENAPT